MSRQTKFFRNINFSRRLGAWFLCGTLLLGSAACGRENGEQKKQDSAQTVKTAEAQGGVTAEDGGLFYQPEEFQLAEGGNYSYNLYDIQITDDRLYCIVSDEENGYMLRCQSLTDGSVTDYPTGYVDCWTVGEDGSLYMIRGETEKREERDDYILKRFLIKWDASQREVYRQDITDLYQQPKISFQYSLAVDAQNRACVLVDRDIYLFDDQGMSAGVIHSNEIQESTVSSCRFGRGADGRVYVTDGRNPATLYTVDYEDAVLKNGMSGIPFGSGRLCCDPEGNFLTVDSMGVYRYDPETKKNVILFKLIETQIPYLQPSASVGVLSDGRIAVAYSDWESGDYGLVLMSATDRPRETKETEKAELILGVMHSFPGLEAAVSRFNSQSETCYITVKTYMEKDEYMMQDGINRMQADIAAGNCPDILNVDTYSMDWRNLVEKGVLEDLTPYLEKSEVLSREDMFENVLRQCTHNGVLAVFPSVLQVQTYVGSGDVLGDQDSWTVDDVIAIADAYPDAFLLGEYSPRTCLLYCLQCTINSFIDADTGKCHFDSEEFQKIMKFSSRAAEGQKKYEDQSADKSWREMARDGELLLACTDMYDVYGPQMAAEPFANPVFVGYPGPDGVGVGTIMPTESFGISAKSRNKEEAWAFLENYLSTRQKHDGGNTGFPVVKSELDAMLEEALADYKVDENGNPVKDEFGNYMTKSIYEISFPNNYTYTAHTLSQEEADVIRNIIENGLLLDWNNPVITIVMEEAPAYFEGQKSLDEVTDIIQNRVQLYVDENM